MLEWHSSLETGHADIDRQHREIYAKMNEIEAALDGECAPACVNQLVNALVDYAYLHFHHEEHTMECVHCPAYGENCAAHREFVVRLQNWFTLFEEGKLPVYALKKLHAESSHWIKTHIEKVDSELRRTSVTGAASVPSAES